MATFAPLTRCPAPGCDTLIDPSRHLCSRCHQQAADAPPKPAEPKPTNPEPARCCGPHGRFDCPDQATVDRTRRKRCERCQRALQAELRRAA